MIRGSAGRQACRVRAGAVEAASRLVAAGGLRGSVGVVLGTGLGGLVSRVDEAFSVDACETGWLSRSSAIGHAGRLVCGTLCGRNIVVLQGRVHGYEGYAAEALTRGVELLAAMGVQTILLTNAAGGLCPTMKVGQLVVVTDHIDCVGLLWGNRDAPLSDCQMSVLGDQSQVHQAAHGYQDKDERECLYDAGLIAQSLEATRRAGVAAQAGVYAYVSGPSYETRAEYRMLRRMGADAVGMSTVPEVLAARHLGLRVAAVSIVTNVARPDAPSHTDAEEVCRVAATAVRGVEAILESLVTPTPEPVS